MPVLCLRSVDINHLKARLLLATLLKWRIFTTPPDRVSWRLEFFVILSKMFSCCAYRIVLMSLLGVVSSSYSEDQCNWRGSGLSQLPSSVEQITLHCAEGTVDWLYPQGAVRISLSPRLPSVAAASRTAHVTTCIRPAESFQGAQLYMEHEGSLEHLAGDGQYHHQSSRVHCFQRAAGEKVVLFLQASLHRDVSRRTAAFQYELRGDWDARFTQDTDMANTEEACRPCSDSEMLMAVCTSDFVVRANILSVAADPDLDNSVIQVSATRVYRQKYVLFGGSSRLRQSGEIHTLRRCGVKPGAGSFLFTGQAHFGKAWLGCAPRYKDFHRVYEEAQQNGSISCELEAD